VTCLSVADVDKHTGWISKIGGKVIQPPAEMANRGRYCIISDPQGAPLVLLRSTSGDPDKTEPRINEWMWDELWTSDPQAVLSFYQHLGDYTAEQVNPEEDVESYWFLVRNKEWQAGITKIPFEDVPPQWVPVIRVADLAETAAKAVAFGGKMLLESDKSQNDVDIALIEDPSGGIFMVQSLQPDESSNKEE
jgi:predicted enzyme related to lactoylglutathione lyase